MSFPDDTSAVVVTGSPWSGDAAAEWYPYLTARQSLATVQGHEFAGDWVERRDAANELAVCATEGIGCLEDLIRSEWPDADIVFMPKGRVYGSDADDCCPALRESMRADVEVLYDGPGATIFRLPMSSAQRGG